MILSSPWNCWADDKKRKSARVKGQQVHEQHLTLSQWKNIIAMQDLTQTQWLVDEEAKCPEPRPASFLSPLSFCILNPAWVCMRSDYGSGFGFLSWGRAEKGHMLSSWVSRSQRRLRRRKKGSSSGWWIISISWPFMCIIPSNQGKELMILGLKVTPGGCDLSKVQQVNFGVGFESRCLWFSIISSKFLRKLYIK